MIAICVFANEVNWSAPAIVIPFAMVWYGAEMALAYVARWHLSPFYPFHALMRDLMLPVLWLDGLLGSRFEWRGNAMSIAVDNPI